MKITGPFQVTMKPLDTYATGTAGGSLGRMSLDKTFSGELEATSQGEMLTGMGTVQGSAGYVAIEQVRGTLSGKTGTFMLQHFGIMHKETGRLLLEVIPDSGTGELTGLSGTMDILREDGKHQYAFTYDLPA